MTHCHSMTVRSVPGKRHKDIAQEGSSQRKTLKYTWKVHQTFCKVKAQKSLYLVCIQIDCAFLYWCKFTGQLCIQCAINPLTNTADGYNRSAGATVFTGQEKHGFHLFHAIYTCAEYHENIYPLIVSDRSPTKLHIMAEPNMWIIATKHTFMKSLTSNLSHHQRKKMYWMKKSCKGTDSRDHTLVSKRQSSLPLLQQLQSRHSEK